MIKFLTNRTLHFLILVLFIFYVLVTNLFQFTIINGEYYYQKSLTNRIRKMETFSGRGDITDRHGKVLAHDEIVYTLQLNASLIPESSFSDTVIHLYDFLSARRETQLEFPINYSYGAFSYQWDSNIRKWLKAHNYDVKTNAKDVFESEKRKHFIPMALSDSNASVMLINKGIYLPIDVRTMKFLDQLAKEDFLSSYQLPLDSSAESAFYTLRKRREFRIDDTITDEDAYKIMVYRYHIKRKGYYKYEPILISGNISKETAILINERGYEFPGFYTSVNTKRVYPYKELTSHMVGYLGRISTDQEIERYVNQQGYNPNQKIGKSGLEASMENVLSGTAGFDYVEVDVYGKYVGDIDERLYGLDHKKAKMGKDIQSTIDVTFQAEVRDILVRAMNALKEGKVYESEWGNYKFDPFEHVEVGNVTVVNPHTGEVLAAVSYPSYDPTLLADGISYEQWDQLTASHSKNPLSARPMLNTVTMMAVQPGSIYKMITGYAALNQGLNPYMKLYDDGYVEIGNQKFAGWLWNEYGGKHGWLNFYDAMEVSCNYYFYDISTGKDYYKKKPLDFIMNHSLLIEQSKQFGLNEKTGIEVPEVVMGVPDPEKKARTVRALLRQRLRTLIPEYFPENLYNTRQKMNQLLDTILSWAEENPPRIDIINMLSALGVNTDFEKTSHLADIIKYDYFNLMYWYEGDTLNLSIGQGEHAYTPIQIARYVSMLVNGGRKIELSMLKQVGPKVIDKNKDAPQVLDTTYLEIIQKSMHQVIYGKHSSIKEVFQDFPIEIGGKTGTAEKEGLIPPLDEMTYYKEHLADFLPGISEKTLEEKTAQIMSQRSDEISELEKQIRDLTQEADPEKEAKRKDMQLTFQEYLRGDYLNKADAMKQAMFELSDGALNQEALDEFKNEYDNFAWFVSYAPYENPEIVVVVSIPQGGHGYYAAPIARDVIAKYYNLSNKSKETEEKK